MRSMKSGSMGRRCCSWFAPLLRWQSVHGTVHMNEVLDTDTKYSAVSFIETYTGRAFWPLEPKPEDVAIIDIAPNLSNQGRYSGATFMLYVTAQHKRRAGIAALIGEVVSYVDD